MRDPDSDPECNVAHWVGFIFKTIKLKAQMSQRDDESKSLYAVNLFLHLDNSILTTLKDDRLTSSSVFEQNAIFNR